MSQETKTAEVQPLKRNRKSVGHLTVTDARTCETTEFVAMLDVDMLTATVNGMLDAEANYIEFLGGMLIIVSRPVPTPAAKGGTN